ncbi:MAG: Rossmann-like and DUF2520 domain-containing protein [bacterium]
MDTKPLTLNLVGCGKAGSVLAYLWHQAGIFNIGRIVTRSRKSAGHAVKRLGVGTPVSSLNELGEAELTMIAVPDQHIVQVASSLAEHNTISPGSIVFHLSGALESSELTKSGLANAQVASVHPLRSFADFHTSVADFSGTWCGYEGSSELWPLLNRAFEQIGARMFQIEPNQKLIYHSASVIVSNYVNALVESGLSAYQLAGIDRDTGQNLIEPILRNTCENIISSDPGTALTGPIARGDWQIVRQELEKLESANSDLAEVYRVMGKATLALAVSNDLLTPDQVSQLELLLS